jgi:hypothetical protein
MIGRMHREARRSHLASAAIAGMLAATLTSLEARADDARSHAARVFQTGSEAYLRKDYRTAGRAFDEAYRIAPRGAAAYNGGLAWEGAAERARAADDYTRALEASDLGAAERADATGRLRALEQTLARLSFVAPAGSRLVLDDVELSGSSASVHVDPGKHSLRVEYPGGQGESRALQARGGTEQFIKLEVPAREDTSVPPVAAEPAESPDHAHEDIRPSAREHHDAATPSPSPDHTLAWIMFGGAAAASVVAIVVFEEGLAARNEFVAGGDIDRSQHDEATALRTGAWVAWGVAGGLAATGAILYFTVSSPALSQGSAGASVAIDRRGVTFGVRF